MAFDARELKLLPVGQHITSPEHPGLRVEAFSDRRTWTYRYRSPIDGALRQVKIGTWPAVSTNAAIVAWEGLRDARAAGRDPALEAKAKKDEEKRLAAEQKAKSDAGRYTVLDACNDYFEGHIVKHRSKKNVTEIRRMFDKMLGPLGDLAAAEVARSQAFDYIKGIANNHPVQAGKMRTEMGAAWDYAYDSGRLPDTVPNWWRMILRGKLKSKGKKVGGVNIGTVKRCLDRDEIGCLIRWLPNMTLLIRDVLTLYLWTDCRGAEICAAEGKEVAKEDDGLWWWVVPKEKTKNARHDNATDLRVPLFGRALEVMLRRKSMHGDGYLFPQKPLGRKVVPPVEQKTIQASVYAYQPYSKSDWRKTPLHLPVTHWAPHDLRRSSRTLLASLRCPNEVGEAILGHIPPGVVGVYNVHAYDAERVEWLKRLSDHLEILAAPQ